MNSGTTLFPSVSSVLTGKMKTHQHLYRLIMLQCILTKSAKFDFSILILLDL